MPKVSPVEWPFFSFNICRAATSRVLMAISQAGFYEAGDVSTASAETCVTADEHAVDPTVQNWVYDTTACISCVAVLVRVPLF